MQQLRCIYTTDRAPNKVASSGREAPDRPRERSTPGRVRGDVQRSTAAAAASSACAYSPRHRQPGILHARSVHSVRPSVCLFVCLYVCLSASVPSLRHDVMTSHDMAIDVTTTQRSIAIAALSVSSCCYK